jgi:hypothetical protein
VEAEYWRDPGMFGPTIDDIDQGNTGDCYFIAALGAVAQANPDRVRKMVRRNANVSYTMTREGYDKVGGTGRFDGSRPAIALEFITADETSGSGVTTLKNF